ncbi:14540_t:CDS:2, partial [Racocetra persica]
PEFHARAFAHTVTFLKKETQKHLFQPGLPLVLFKFLSMIETRFTKRVSVVDITDALEA